MIVVGDCEAHNPYCRETDPVLGFPSAAAVIAHSCTGCTDTCQRNPLIPPELPGDPKACKYLLRLLADVADLGFIPGPQERRSSGRVVGGWNVIGADIQITWGVTAKYVYERTRLDIETRLQEVGTSIVISYPTPPLRVQGAPFETFIRFEASTLLLWSTTMSLSERIHSWWRRRQFLKFLQQQRKG